MTRALAGAACAVLLTASHAAAQLKPIASGPTNWNDVTIDLMSVERKGGVLTVKWSVKNAGSKTATVQFGLTGNKKGTYVLDEESGTKYYALTDKEGNVLASEHEHTGDGYGISDYLEGGATNRYWAKFPAPPAAVKSINIFFTNSDPFEGDAITEQ